MATSTTVRSKGDNQKWIRLPPELKQEHGDGIIMCADEDSALQNCLSGLIDQVGLLEDGSRPNVIPWDDACPWVQSSVSNLEACLNYYTLVMCIITENMLQSRHFADAALLTAIETHKDSFIPLFKSHSDFKALAHNPKWEDKLPGLYKTLKPIYLEGVNNDRIISQLKRLFNFHIHKKMQRMDKQDKLIEEAYHKMSPTEIYTQIDEDTQTDDRLMPQNSWENDETSHLFMSNMQSCKESDEFLHVNTELEATSNREYGNTLTSQTLQLSLETSDIEQNSINVQHDNNLPLTNLHQVRLHQPVVDGTIMSGGACVTQRHINSNLGDNLNVYDSNDTTAENSVESQNINYTSHAPELINLGSMQPDDRDTRYGSVGGQLSQSPISYKEYAPNDRDTEYGTAGGQLTQSPLSHKEDAHDGAQYDSEEVHKKQCAEEKGFNNNFSSIKLIGIGFLLGVGFMLVANR